MIRAFLAFVILHTFAAIAATMALAAPASAQEPAFTVGDIVRPSQTFLCDTHEQVAQILTAMQKSWPHAVVEMQRLNAQRNSVGDPACIVMRGQFPVRTDQVVDMWSGLNGPHGPVPDQVVLKVYYLHRTGELPAFMPVGAGLVGPPEPQGIAL